MRLVLLDTQGNELLSFEDFPDRYNLHDRHDAADCVRLIRETVDAELEYEFDLEAKQHHNEKGEYGQ